MANFTSLEHHGKAGVYIQVHSAHRLHALLMRQHVPATA